MNEVVCKNCEFHYKGVFCPQCGQSIREDRIDAKYILHDVPHSIFHIDHGFFYTLKNLFTRPGAMIEDYLSGKRVKYFRPLSYVVIMSAVCTFIIKGIEWLIGRLVNQNPVPTPGDESFFKHYFSLFVFIMIPFASMITWLTFRKKRYNYWEHFVANTYISAQLNLVLVAINLVGLIVVLFTKKFAGVDFGVFIGIFMSGFLYLYGSVFGYMFTDSMKGRYKILKISLTLVLMNTFLFILYFSGFQITGIMRPW